ncbi:VWA domain-containing protein [Candidatus Methanarcanum hacksteinii]|uniref:VWA domain-containing protein n=1 Tax=Candidatus Methanarcanum hacksteinii TaxID=2911857 RepID=UPI0037DC9AC6
MDEGHIGKPVSVCLPITAMEGMEEARDALSVLLCSPDVHSLLIRGPSGTGKSVAARSISRLSDMGVIEIPQNITREQLFGSIDIETAMRTGRRVVSESVLGRADGKILVVDNANLLPEDILQSIVNAVSDGMVMAEVDGVSVNSALDAKLICTMDPNEGELSDHILDRFDMCVITSTEEDTVRRKNVVRMNLAYESDPDGFIESMSESENKLRERIESATPETVDVTDSLMSTIAEVCSNMYVEGHRGDMSVLNVSCALSSLNGKDFVGQDELKEAVSLCLQHRRREPPDEEDSPPPEQSPEQEESDDEQSPEVEGSDAHSTEGEGQNADGDDGDGDGESHDGGQGEKVFAIGESFDVRDFVPPEDRFNKNRRSGKRDLSRSTDSSGRMIGNRIPVGMTKDIALCATIRAAAPYQTIREHKGLAIALRKEDLREKVRIRKKGTRLLFVVDGSGSVGAHDRMVSVKGAILSMLDDAYRRRDEVGLVVFRGDRAETVLPMTRSVLTAYKCLQDVPTGGRTPLIEGLKQGYSILSHEADMGYEPVMVILTDGRGNSNSEGRKPTKEEFNHMAETLRDSGIRMIIIDTETGYVRFGKATELSNAIGAQYMRLEELNAEHLSESIRTAMKLFE